MPRARWIKPEFFTDQKVSKLSPLARLLFLGLGIICDDGWVCPCRVEDLKALLFRYSSESLESIQRALDELLRSDRVRLIERGDDVFGYLPRMEGHHKINHPSNFRHLGKLHERLTLDSHPFSSDPLEASSDTHSPGTIGQEPVTRNQIKNSGKRAASPINPVGYKQQEPTDAPPTRADLPNAGLPEEPEQQDQPTPDPIGYLMPLVRQHLYLDNRPPLTSENGRMVRYQEGRDVLILRALLKHRSPEELASAIQGIARLRDSGQLKTLGPQFYPRKPMTMRVLYNTKVLVRGDEDLRWAMDAAIRETLDSL